MTKYARRCDVTGKGINKGFVVVDGELYFATKFELLKHLRTLNWVDCNGKRSTDCKTSAELLLYFYNEDYYYYTEWDVEQECDVEWYTADGVAVVVEQVKMGVLFQVHNNDNNPASTETNPNAIFFSIEDAVKYIKYLQEECGVDMEYSKIICYESLNEK